MKKIALIGSGLIGKERLKAVKDLRNLGREIPDLIIYDPYNPELINLAKEYNANIENDLNEIENGEFDLVIIATPHDIAEEISFKMLSSGKKILVEKPLGRSLKAAQKIASLAKDEKKLFVGFNYRFFQGVSSALKDIQSEKFGKIISVNFVLGHGGNPGMEKGWKFDPVKAGGGCLIDPGIHILDLCNVISKNSLKVESILNWKGFWNTGIEEECHLLLSSGEIIFNIQISVVKWRSTFTMEINGTDAYGRVTGRGRSYGNQNYVIGKRWGWLDGKSQKDSEALVLETDCSDSFTKELDAILFSNTEDVIYPCTGLQAVENMKIMEDCYSMIREVGVN